jgi:hypothetical protein
MFFVTGALNTSSFLSAISDDTLSSSKSLLIMKKPNITSRSNVQTARSDQRLGFGTGRMVLAMRARSSFQEQDAIAIGHSDHFSARYAALPTFEASKMFTNA